ERRTHPRRAATDDARVDLQRADARPDDSPGQCAQRRRTEGRGGVPRGTSVRAALTAGGREPLHLLAADARSIERGWLEWLGQRRREHTIPVRRQRGTDGGRSTEAQTEVGIWILGCDIS